MSEPTDLQELASYWKFRALHFRDLSVVLKQELLALKNNTSEDCRINSITHRDKTGNTAVENVTRDQKKRK
jgi:hypothetical protein